MSSPRDKRPRERVSDLSPRPLLVGGRRRRRPLPFVLFGLLLSASAIVVVIVLLASGGTTRHSPSVGRAGSQAALPAATGRGVEGGGSASRFAVDLSRPDAVHLRFVRKPRAGLLFEVPSGRVLWRLNPTRRLAIASLTKMMTALLVVERDDPHDRVRITRQAVHTAGSGVGVLPKGKKVQLEALLNGLLLVSGNDAAVALATHVAGGVRQFVGLMNRRAGELGLSCTHFSSPHGLIERGNHSCAADLAALARADLHQRRIRRIVRRDHAVLRFPIKGGHLFLYNNNPLMRAGYRGVTGLKTGYTDRAGRSIVATARRGKVELGVVLLHSYNPADQARKLLDRGFELLR